MLRVQPSALVGASALLVLILAIVGVRTAWAERAAEPVPVTSTSSLSVDAVQDTREALAGGAEFEPTAESSASAASPTDGDAPPVAPLGAAASAYVHVIGAVREPGVVQVPAGSRVSDVVETAGGLTGDADLSGINLARVVVDGERIWVPVEGEELPAEVVESTPEPVPGAVSEATTANGTGEVEAATQIDLNSADSAALQTLPGVGPVTAESILTWRTEHGRFNTIDELLEVSGIGPKTLDKLRPRVIIGGP